MRMMTGKPRFGLVTFSSRSLSRETDRLILVADQWGGLPRSLLANLRSMELNREVVRQARKRATGMVV